MCVNVHNLTHKYHAKHLLADGATVLPTLKHTVVAEFLIYANIKITACQTEHVNYNSDTLYSTICAEMCINVDIYKMKCFPNYSVEYFDVLIMIEF